MGFTGGCVVVRGRVDGADLREIVAGVVPEGAQVLTASFTIARRRVSALALSTERIHPGNDQLTDLLWRAGHEAVALSESDFLAFGAYELRVEHGEDREPGGLSVIGAAGRGSERIGYTRVVPLGVEALIEAVGAPELPELLDRAVDGGRLVVRADGGWNRSRARPDLHWRSFGMTLWPSHHAAARARYEALRRREEEEA